MTATKSFSPCFVQEMIMYHGNDLSNDREYRASALRNAQDVDIITALGAI